jgi:DNA-binding MurR/RpiR family transcriptional regulator
MRRTVPAPDRERFHLLLRGSHQRVGATGRRFVQFVSQNRELVLASSAAELGARLGTSDATIVRTVQALGFAGLGELKRAILDSIMPASGPADDMRQTLAALDASTDAALQNALQTHAEGMKVLSSTAFRLQVQAAVRALDVAQRIVIFGIGPSAGLAVYVSGLLARTGRPNRRLDTTGAMLADQLLDLREGDVLLLLAYGRLYKEISAVFNEARSLGLQTILITEAAGNPLSNLADLKIFVPRGRPGRIALHGATMVALETLVLSLVAARPVVALHSLDRLTQLRRSVTTPLPVRKAPKKQD